jgi:outer membrane protein assembly factor BamB
MTQPQTQPVRQPERQLADLVFVGFNSRVIALDRYTGEKVWDWKSPQGSGYVTIMVDGDRLVVSVMGYTYCLDPIFGQEVWRNPLEGLGIGVATLASANGTAGAASLAAAAAAAAAARSAASG